ncbi:hypothetical protein JVU11DRAFT_361 [Chiua virens]|nr:hypothetical protein JVU11DRAFT_361 [Chiua virens]
MRRTKLGMSHVASSPLRLTTDIVIPSVNGQVRAPCQYPWQISWKCYSAVKAGVCIFKQQATGFALTNYLEILVLIATTLYFTASLFHSSFSTVYFTRNDPWEGLATHCKDAQPIHATEFLERQYQLAHALHGQNASAYVAEPGASALYFGNISGETWGLSERPLLLIVSPFVDQGQVSAQVTILTPSFEEDRAKLLHIPGAEVSFVAWQEDEDPYAVAVEALPTLSRGPIYVDGMYPSFHR